MNKLKRMKLLATGLLLLAGAVYVAARALEPGRPWLHYVAAAAEAAMFGVIAGWLAVVTVVRLSTHLGFIPLPAILPRNQARIEECRSQFIQQNFLSSAAVVARIAAFRPAETLCRWLVRRENAETLAAYATRLVSYALTAVDDEPVRGFLARVVTDALGRANVATALAQLLDVLTENERHHALLDEALAGLDELLAREATRRFIAEEVRKSSPVLLRAINQMLGLKLDERAALKIVDVALKKVSEVRRDREHELRERFDAFVRRFIERLKSDPAMREKIHRMRDEALDNPALAGYVGGLWDEFRAWLPGGMRGRLPGLIVELGEKIDDEAGQ